MPVSGTDINRPMPFMVVAALDSLNPNVYEEYRTTKDMGRMHKGKSKTDSIELAESSLVLKVSLQQLKQPKALQKQEPNNANARQD